jgi:type IV pilus assembly protein PilA
MRKQNGFSLIELLIVVAIILIIAAIAIPNLLRARMSANEASAAGSVRSINNAEASYNAAYSNVGFSTSLPALGGTNPCTPSSSSGCFIDTGLSNGTKSGYSFAVQVGSIPAASGLNLSYSVIATPQALDITGSRYFCSFEDFVLRSSSAVIAPPCAGTVAPLQ